MHESKTKLSKICAKVIYVIMVLVLISTISLDLLSLS
jgi:hypothetical protein